MLFDNNEVLPDKQICKKVARLCDLADCTKLANRILNCSNFIEYDTVKGLYLETAVRSFCKDKFCPVCQIRNRKSDFNKNKTTAEHIVKNFPAAKFFHVTMTIKNTVVINKSILTDMNTAFGKLVKRKKVCKNLLGYYKSLEITYSDKKDFHPHIHAVFAFKSTFTKGADNYISANEWLALWQETLGSKYVSERVSADEIPNVKSNYEAVDEKGNKHKTTTSKSIANVMYYITKHVNYKDYTSHDELENIYVLKSLYEATKNLNLITNSGIFRAEIKEYRKKAKGNTEEKKRIRAQRQQLKSYRTNKIRYNGNSYVPYDNDDT